MAGFKGAAWQREGMEGREILGEGDRGNGEGERGE